MKWPGNNLVLRRLLYVNFPPVYYRNRWVIGSILLATFILFPLLIIILKLFSGPGDSWNHIRHYLLTGYVINTLILIAGTGILTFAIGVSLAWFVSIYDFPGKRFFSWALIMPLAIPTYIIAFVYAGIFDQTGSFAGLYHLIFGLSIPFSSASVMNLPGAIIILSLVLYPYVYLVTRAAFSSQSVEVLEAARGLGYKPSQIFYKIGIPIARPAWVAGLSLVIFEVLNDYGLMHYFGIPTFTTGIFRAWFSLGEPATAIYLSALLLVVVFMVLLMERFQRRGMRYHFGFSSKSSWQFQLSPLKKWILSLAVGLILLLGFVLPVIQLILWSYSSTKQMPVNDFLVLIRNSFGIAIAAAGICLVIAVLLNFTNRLYRSRFISAFIRSSAIGYAIPGAVIAVGVLVSLLFVDRTVINLVKGITGSNPGLILTGSLIALLSAYVVRFFAVSFNPVQSGFEKLGDDLLMVSKSLKISNLKTLFSVQLPLLKGVIITAFLLTFVDILKELPLTLILRPFNFHTLATKTFELASDERVAESALPALLIILTGLLPVILLNTLLTRNSVS